jgi:hypothetical protein
MVEAVEEVAFVADEDVPEARVTQPVPVEPETLPVLPARAPRANGRAHGRRPARAERAATVTATRAKKKVEQADRARAERQALTADELLARYPFEGFGGAGFVKAM